MSVPREFSRMFAARPSGFAVGTNSTVHFDNISTRFRSPPKARSRSQMRHASRPAGSLPCCEQVNKTTGFVRAAETDRGAGSPIRTKCSGRFCTVFPITETDTRLDNRLTADRNFSSSSWVVHVSPPLCSKGVRTGGPANARTGSPRTTRQNAARKLRLATVVHQVQEDLPARERQRVGCQAEAHVALGPRVVVRIRQQHTDNPDASAPD